MFIVRLISAICIFCLLGKANIWLTSISNTVFAIGYRFLLLLSPVFFRLAGKQAIAVSLIFAAAGLALFYLGGTYEQLFGAVLAGIGFSVSGYLIKFEAAQTPNGAARNKIAVNIGCLFAGLLLSISLYNKHHFFAAATTLLLFCAVIAFTASKQKKDIKLPIPQTFLPRQWVIWILVGIAYGINIFGIFSILPQYIIAHSHNLPNWYGAVVLASSGFVILFQLPILNFVGKFPSNNAATKIALAMMLIGMLIIGLPQLFFADTFLGAITWTVLIAFTECFASYLDVIGAQSGFLLIKETAVGIGAGLTVLISRNLPADISSMIIGLIGLIAIILIWVLFFRKDDTETKT